PSQQRLAIADTPLRLELARRIEDLNSPARVFADIDPSGAVDSNTARVGKHSWADSFAAEFKQDIGETVSRFLFRRRCRDGFRRFSDCAFYRIEGGHECANRRESTDE